ncbi:MAG TPA: hypothetical protein DDW52_29280, partial [Planctomycetaceae bacterium]|nr:hypothetical protein [Planctomycetaceae bacterium]
VLKAAAEASGALPSDELKMRLKEFATTLRPHVEAVAKMNVKGFSSTSLQLVPLIASLDNQQLERLQAWLPCLKPLAQQVEFISLAEPGLTSTYAPSNRQAGNKPANSSLVQEIQPLAMMPNYIPEQHDRASNAIEIRREIPRAYSGQFSVHAQNVVGDKVGSGIVFSTPARTRGASHPLSPSQVMDVYGHSTILEIALLVRSVLGASPPNAGNDKLMEDVRRVLADELGAAYDFLSQPDMHHIWQFGCADLANAIRIRDYETVRRLRDDFFTRLPGGVAKSPTGALGWALMVESSLLSVRLADDMTELAASKGCMCGDVTGYCFWGPTPPPESCQAFSEYVQCKWPIQVFTVDPASQDQNIADSYSVTRELQIAAAVAAATGEVSLSTAAEFARKVQVNIDTVALNRTAVGFTHGNDTFGWRYYPRLQSAGTTGLVGTIGQTIMGGPSRDSLLRQRMMEPGIRESVAVVVMPSFVPFVTIESRTSWFHLNDPADRELTLKDSMQLSRAQHAVESFLTCARDCGCYRPGDISQMATVLDQLSSRLPLQRSILQVPYENASGGFEVFRSGMAGLAPELTGWYGAPGIDPTGSTSLFLVGRGFSVHQTRVIVGGRSVSYRLLARDRMEITVPPGVQVLGGPEGRDSRVDVHVATPYGVSSHLLIPKVTPNNRVTTPVSWNPGTMRLTASLAVADNPAATTVQNLVMSPAQPVGAFVPIASLGAEADVKLQLFLQTSAGATPSGSEITVGKGRYNALTSVYEVDPLQLGTLLDTVKAQVQTYVRTGVIPTSAPSVTFLGRGSLNFGSIVHPIEGLLSITVDLTK